MLRYVEVEEGKVLVVRVFEFSSFWCFEGARGSLLEDEACGSDTTASVLSFC